MGDVHSVAVDEEALRALTNEKGFTSVQVVRFSDDLAVNEFVIKFLDVAEGSAAAGEVARLEAEAESDGESAIGLEANTRVVVLLFQGSDFADWASLNDTIIIYDRIRENMELHTTADLEATLNTSVNQTLSRTVLTSVTTLLALLSLFFLGGEVIQPFAKTMLIGVLVGTYSSIFIASPLLLFLEQRYGDGGKPKTQKGPGVNKAVV